tara:strand:+ start:7152 stop:8216 length:1065 start_codon:yes stop_codon:yes gene_type:complete
MAKYSQLQEHENRILYLRHRLEDGFYVWDRLPKRAPKDEKMADMSVYLSQLEAHQTLEAEVIRKTKIHKMLKAIIRLESIPKEEVYAFKRRSNDLLRSWGDALSADPVLQKQVLEDVPEQKEEDKKIIRNMNGRLVYTDNDISPEEKLAPLPSFADVTRTSLGHVPTELDINMFMDAADSNRSSNAGEGSTKYFNGTLLSQQCYQGDLVAVKAAQKLQPSHIDLADYCGITPLQEASLGGFAHIVEYLISEGCSVHCQALDGSTPLMDAAASGHLEVVKILLWDGHVDPACRNDDGKRAIDLVDIEDENAKEIVNNLVKAEEIWNSLPGMISRDFGAPPSSTMGMRRSFSSDED